MTIQTQNRQVKVNSNEAEKAFFYNIIVPDATILIISILTTFGTLLTLFS